MLRAVGFLELQPVSSILGAAFLQGGHLILVENLFQWSLKELQLI